MTRHGGLDPKSAYSETMSESQRPVSLGPSTLVPIGLLVCLCGAVGTGAVWITNSLNQIDYRLKIIEERMSEPVTKAEFGYWLEVFRARNTTHTPPISIPSIPIK